MKPHILITLALLLPTACDAPRVPVVHLDQTDGEAPFERVEEACAFWGLDCYEADDEDGALTIMLGDRCAHDQRHGDEPLCGEVFDEDPCSPMLFAAYWDMALEHEIGHVFGLKHSDDEANVMFWFGAMGTESSEQQERRVQRRARALAACPGPW